VTEGSRKSALGIENSKIDWMYLTRRGVIGPRARNPLARNGVFRCTIDA